MISNADWSERLCYIVMSLMGPYNPSSPALRNVQCPYVRGSNERATFLPGTLIVRI